MSRKILNFRNFLLEQEEEEEDNRLKQPETEKEAKSRIASSILKSFFGDNETMDKIMDVVDSTIDVTKEVKNGQPYTGCGSSQPYELKKTPISLKTFKLLLNYLNEKKVADYTRAIDYLEEGKSIIIGLRNYLEVKKKPENNDKFTDAIYLIPEGAKDTDTFLPYQATTSPSLAYYGKKPLNPKGTGIKMPGTTLYNLRMNELNHGKYKMMVEAEKTRVARYPLDVTKIDTYLPAKQYMENTGIQIHKSSETTGVCIGPWSAGCQVFANGSEFNEFITKAESQTKNGGQFIYALIELDSIPNDVMSSAMKGTTPEEAKEKEAIAKAEADKKKKASSTKSNKKSTTGKNVATMSFDKNTKTWKST